MTVANDFNVQQIPFLTALNHYLKNKTGMWCWNVDLGTQIIAGYSFYNMGSPFVWLSFLFPKACVPYLTGGLYVLKYTIAGITAYLYLRMFVKNRWYAVLGSILYSFSGFQSVNLLYFHFHDVVAFFPLMLLGLEQLINKRKKTLFIFAVFVNCITNYFFFISEVIFLALYYILRFWKKDIKLFFRDAMICLGCGIIGTGMAALIFLPSILYIIGNSRANASLNVLPLTSYAGYILLSAKGFLLPAESMSHQSCVVLEDYMSTCCYVPLIGGSLAFAYMLTKKKDWLTRLLLILWIISCSPTMDSAFYMFTQHYKRWWFMFALMLITASVMVLDNREKYRIKEGILINIILLVLFAVGLVCLDRISWIEESFIFRRDIFAISFSISLLGLLLTWFWCVARSPYCQSKLFMAGLTVCVSVFCSATTFYTLALYRENEETGREYMKHYQLGLRLKKLDDQYRYNLNDNILTFSGEAAGVGSFSSTISNSIQEFDQLFDYAWQNLRPLSDVVIGIKELLGAKYHLVTEVLEGQDVEDAFDIEGTRYYVVAENVCPIGFTQDSYITTDELKGLSTDMRGIAMVDNLVIDSKDQQIVEMYLEHKDNLNYAEDHSELAGLVETSQKHKVSDFKRTPEGFECSVEPVSKEAVFFSVPYDNGWSAYANGNQVDILNCGGMMGILLSPGKYSIVFRYQVPGLRTGGYISVISFCVFMVFALLEGKRSPIFVKGED